MRNIKFRAWHKGKKRMVSVNDIYFESKEIELPIETDVTDEYWWDTTTWNLDDVILNQYTGLKDKNHVDIYEGDIVRFNDFWSELSGGNVGDTIRTCFVKYIISGFFLEDVLDEEYEEDLGMALINDDEFEVIGNIFENPDLLEVDTSE